MIYRNINGDIIIINKMDFKNDKLYYKKIMDIKKPFTKLNKINNSQTNSQSNSQTNINDINDINDINGITTLQQK